MKRIFTLISLLSLVWCCISKGKNNSEITGKDLFKENCVLCHGIKGDLMTNGAKNLNLSKISLEERILVITNGRNVMTGFATKLSTEEISKVAEFTLSLKNSEH